MPSRSSTRAASSSNLEFQPVNVIVFGIRKLHLEEVDVALHVLDGLIEEIERRPDDAPTVVLVFGFRIPPKPPPPQSSEESQSDHT
jgi:hypothetical protein